MANALDVTSRAAGTGVSVEYRDARGIAAQNLPQKIAVFAQGSSSVTYALTPWRMTSAKEAAARYGLGSPIDLIARALQPDNGDGVGTIPVTIYPMLDHASGAVSAGAFSFSGTATAATSFRAIIGGVASAPFTIAAGAVNATTAANAARTAIQASVHMPVTVAGTATVTTASKWEGASANGIKIELVPQNPDKSFNGINVSITQPTGGANNPDVTTPLALVLDRWETMCINQMEYTDTTTLDAFKVWGDGRWLPTFAQPAMVFTGCTEADRNTATTVSDARKTDYINIQTNHPGSMDLPFVKAARSVARIAKMANNNPATGYVGLDLSQTLAPAEASLWDFNGRDAVRKAGGCTVVLVDGVEKLSDVVTMFHPTNEDPPSYSSVVTITKIANAVYNYRLALTSPDLDAAPIVANNQVTNNPNARTPSGIKGKLDGVTDALGLAAIVDSPDLIKANTTVTRSTQNSNRVDCVVPLYLSGNTEQKALEIYFSLFAPTA